MWRSTARRVIPSVAGDRAVAPPLGDERERLALAGREPGDARVGLPPPLPQHLVDHAGVDDGAARDDLAQRPRELAGVGEALLQQIGASPGAVLEQGEGVERLDVLAEDDDPDLRMRRAQRPGEADALVRPGRRHADVGEHGVGPLALDRRLEAREVAAGRRELEAVEALQEARDALAGDEVVLSENHPNRPQAVGWWDCGQGLAPWWSRTRDRTPGPGPSARRPPSTRRSRAPGRG